MFTIEQIKAAHSKVKSGADFPAYISDLRDLGVVSYDTFVSDGHTDYHGAEGAVSSAAKYDEKPIADLSDGTQFQTDLKLHQKGQTDYPTFCDDAAKSGIEKWTVDIPAMTCTYFDKSGKEILREKIPE